MLLHSDPLAEVVRVHVDMDTAGQVVQNLRLPQSVQVLEVRRHGCDLAPRPFTTIRYAAPNAATPPRHNATTPPRHHATTPRHAAQLPRSTPSHAPSAVH